MSQAANTFSTLFAGPIRLRLGLFLLFALGIVIISMTFFALSIGKPYMGISLSMKDRGWAVEYVDANGQARRSGINIGDRPVEINGQPAETFLEQYREPGLVFGMILREMTVIDERGQLKSVALKESTPSKESVIELTAWFVVSLIFWIIGFYVFFKQPRNTAALLLCLSGLTFGLALSANMAGERAIPTALQFHVAASIIGPWLLLHFLLVLPEERVWLRSNPLVYLIYLPPAITLVLFPIIGYADGQPVQWFRTVRLFGYGLGFLATVGVAILNYFGTVSARTRQQMKIVLIGCLAALVPLVALNLIPLTIWRQPIVQGGISILFIGFIPLGMGYAVVTQKLLDIDVIIRRGIIYGTITLVMATILSAVVFAVVVFQEAFGIGEQIIVALAAGGLATILFGPTKKGVETLVDRLFYKDRYDYRQIINALSDSLKLLKDTTEISRVLVGTASHTLNLAGGCLFVKGVSGFEVGASQGIFAGAGKQGQLLSLLSQRSDRIEFPNSAAGIGSNVEFLIPLVAGEKEVGILYLSPKVSRQNYSSDDIYLLQGLASVGAIALRGALLVRDVSLRDTFVSIASHELRTPLTSIVGYADLLLRRDLPDATRKQWLQIILDNGEKIAAMLDDLLDISRIRSGLVSLKLERLQLSGILSEQLAAIRESTNKHEFVVDIAPDLRDVLVDHDKFGQIIGNLLSNAVKYSPNGGHITLSARNDPEHSRVLVGVADEGIGISPADKELLFKTFHRIQRPETQGIRGIGMGLYIVKEWTEAMGGMVWFDSELNKGSTFFVAMPIG